MSISCTKDYSITVSGTDVYAYFKCDEATAATGITDEVSGLTLPEGNGYGVDSQPGKISTGVRIGYRADLPFFKCMYFDSNPASTHWDLSADSWTIRFWVLLNGDGFTFSQIATSGIYFDWLTPGETVRLTVYLGGVGITATDSLPSGDWHRVIGWHENGVGIGIKVDDNPSVTTANVDSMSSGARRIYVGGPTGYVTPPTGDKTMDEYAIWKRKLSDAEMTTDWNSGNGKTYPNIP